MPDSDSPSEDTQPVDIQPKDTPQDALNEVRNSWDSLADDWRIQVGDDGDRNRLLNSDPVLWEMAGNVHGKRVLDAGCGTGYLTKQLADRGARVTGVDLSTKMVEISKVNHPGIDFRVDSVSQLQTCTDAEFDLIVSNYVLMDNPDLEGAIAAFHRVLKPGGAAIAIFSHPCFPAGWATPGKPPEISHHWKIPYFERAKVVEPPWKHFTSEFIWFHRPLSDYFKVFVAAGFVVEALEEPHLTADRDHLVKTEKERRSYSTRVYSIAFKLRK